MKVEDKQLNLVWASKEYFVSENCIGTRFRDIQGILPDRYELSDGKEAYGVSEEVFDLWLEAYKQGKQEKMRYYE